MFFGFIGRERTHGIPSLMAWTSASMMSAWGPILHLPWRMVERAPLMEEPMCHPEEHMWAFFDPSVYKIVEGGMLRSQVVWAFATSSLVPGLMLILDWSRKKVGPELSSMGFPGGIMAWRSNFILPSPPPFSLAVTERNRILLQ